MDKTYCLGLYEKSMPGPLSIPEKLRYTGAAGYDFMEMSIDETDEKLARLDWGSQTIREVQEAQWETGTPIRSFCLSGHRRFPLGDMDEAVRKQSLWIMKKAIRLADALGTRIIQIAGYDTYYGESTEETRSRFAEGLEASVQYAAQYGVMLAFETMETEFLNTVEKALYWVRKINSPYLQIYPDCGNITNAAVRYQTDALADLRRGQGHLAALHLKETRPGIFREVPYGEGHVDFAAICQTALRLGVRYFTAEFWHCGEENWLSILNENRVFLQEKIEGVERTCPSR